MEAIKINLLQTTIYNALYPSILIILLQETNLNRTKVAIAIGVLASFSSVIAMLLPLILSSRIIFRLNILISILCLMLLIAKIFGNNQYLLFLIYFGIILIDRLTRITLKLRNSSTNKFHNLENLRVNLRRSELLGILFGSGLSLTLLIDKESFFNRNFSYFLSGSLIVLGLIFYQKNLCMKSEKNSQIGLEKRQIFDFKLNKLPLITSMAGVNIAVFEVLVPVIIVQSMPSQMILIPETRIIVAMIVFFQIVRIRRKLVGPTQIYKGFIIGLMQQIISFGILYLAFQNKSPTLVILASILQGNSGAHYIASQIVLTTKYTESREDTFTQVIWSAFFGAVVFIFGIVLIPLHVLIGNDVFILISIITIIPIVLLIRDTANLAK